MNASHSKAKHAELIDLDGEEDQVEGEEEKEGEDCDREKGEAGMGGEKKVEGRGSAAPTPVEAASIL